MHPDTFTTGSFFDKTTKDAQDLIDKSALLNTYQQQMQNSQPLTSGYMQTLAQATPVVQPYGVCPGCGYCQHCGRSNQPYHPYPNKFWC